MPTTAPWPPTDPGQRQRLLAHLAHEYFVEGTSKIALGKKSGLSRFQVAALLQEAQDTGIVRIEIAVPLENSDEDLARAAGLQRLVTVGSAQWPADREALAKAVAREITRVLHDDDVLGISWSRTLQLVVHDLPALPHNDVIQLAGALSTDDRAAESPRLLASLRCRSAWPLWAPLVVEQADSLKKSREIELTLRRGRTTAGSDAAQLAQLTHVPQLVWIAVWLTATVAALVVGTALMLPGWLSISR